MTKVSANQHKTLFSFGIRGRNKAVMPTKHILHYVILHYVDYATTITYLLTLEHNKSVIIYNSEEDDD